MKKKETFHLMAVPRHFVDAVIQEGGRLMQLKNRQWLNPDDLELLRWRETPDPKIHIRDLKQHRHYDMMGKTHEEDMSLCKAVFEQSRGTGYTVFLGTLDQVDCEDCQKYFNQSKA